MPLVIKKQMSRPFVAESTDKQISELNINTKMEDIFKVIFFSTLSLNFNERMKKVLPAIVLIFSVLPAI